MRKEFPIAFINLLRNYLSWNEGVSLSLLSRYWNYAISEAPSKHYTVKCLTVEKDFIHFQLAHNNFNESDSISFSLNDSNEDAIWSSSCPRASSSSTLSPRSPPSSSSSSTSTSSPSSCSLPSASTGASASASSSSSSASTTLVGRQYQDHCHCCASFLSLRTFVYDIGSVNTIRLNSTNESQLNRLLDFFETYCQHWKCETIFVSKFSRSTCKIMQLFSPFITSLYLENIVDFEDENPVEILELLSDFFQKAQLLVLSMRIEMANRMFQSGIPIQLQYQGSLFITVDINMDLNHYKDPATWINNELLELIIQHQLSLYLSIRTGIIEGQSNAQLDNMIIGLINEVDSHIVSKEPSEKFHIYIRFNGQHPYIGQRINYDFEQWNLHISS